MSDHQNEAKVAISLAIVATVLVDPLNPGLTREELKDIVLNSGIAPGLFDEVCGDELERRTIDGKGVIRPGPLDLNWVRGGDGYPSQVPIDAAYRLGDIFKRLNVRGTKVPKTLELLRSEWPDATELIDGALGLMLTLGVASATGDGYVSSGMERVYGKRIANHRLEGRMEVMVKLVRNAIAARSGSSVPTSTPSQRFHMLLKKLGLDGLAGWWANNHREFVVLADHCPTASTVLAASLLEASLVAIAKPAQNAGHWTKLATLPKDWKLGELIRNAENSGVFSASDAAHARSLADLRNRIHVGKFADGSPQQFKVPHTNDHEARMAKEHLSHLLNKILEWPPVAALA